MLSSSCCVFISMYLFMAEVWWGSWPCPAASWRVFTWSWDKPSGRSLASFTDMLEKASESCFSGDLWTLLALKLKLVYLYGYNYTDWVFSPLICTFGSLGLGRWASWRFSRPRRPFWPQCRNRSRKLNIGFMVPGFVLLVFINIELTDDAGIIDG